MDALIGTVFRTLTVVTPLLFGALGENVVQKTGLVNVGLEGMMLVGAFAAIFGALKTGNPYLGILYAIFAGILLALLFAGFAVRLAANQVVVGVVINLLALGLTGTLYRAQFGTTGTFLETKPLPTFFGNLTPLTLLAIAMVPLVWWWLQRTRYGLELRACGEQPVAAEAAGVNVARRRMAAALFGGAMAGLAGAALSVGDARTFIENMTAGRGFIALAIVTSGRWNPWGCLVAAMLFGFVEALQSFGQARGWQLPYQLFLALPYIVTLLVLMRGGKFSQAPASLGRPYRRA
jgi:simple sugar transport system permease protein